MSCLVGRAATVRPSVCLSVTALKIKAKNVLTLQGNKKINCVYLRRQDRTHPELRRFNYFMVSL